MVRKETAAHQVSNILAIHEVRLTGLYRIFFCFFHVFPIVIEMVRKETAAHQVSNTLAIYEVRLTGLYRIFFCFLHVFPIVNEGAITNFPYHRVITISIPPGNTLRLPKGSRSYLRLSFPLALSPLPLFP